MGRKMLVKRGVCASRWAPTTGKNAAQRVAPGKTAFIKDVATSGNEKNGFHVKWRPRESLFFARWNAAIEENHFYPSPSLHPPDCFQPDKERRRLLDMHLDNSSNLRPRSVIRPRVFRISNLAKLLTIFQAWCRIPQRIDIYVGYINK